jgi:hypothetical protein
MRDKTVAAVHDWLAVGRGALATWLGDGRGVAAVDAGAPVEGAAHPAQAAASARTPAAGIRAT